MQKITSLSAKVFGRQSKEFRKIGGQAFWPRLYIYMKRIIKMRLLYMLSTKLDYIIKLTIYDISVGLEKKIKNYTKVLNLPVNVKKKKIQQKWTIWSLDN